MGWIFTDLLSEDTRIGTVRYTRNKVRKESNRTRPVQQTSTLPSKLLCNWPHFLFVRIPTTWAQRNASQPDTSRIFIQTLADSLEMGTLAQSLWLWLQQVHSCLLWGWNENWMTSLHNAIHIDRILYFLSSMLCSVDMYSLLWAKITDLYSVNHKMTSVSACLPNCKCEPYIYKP